MFIILEETLCISTVVWLSVSVVIKFSAFSSFFPTATPIPFSLSKKYDVTPEIAIIKITILI